MVDIIGARCLSCGHIVRVPASLGGRKAKCPKCHGIITIPSPGDSTLDFISDAELPEVAKEGAPEVLEDGSIDEEDISQPPPEEEVAEGIPIDEEEQEERVPARGTGVRRQPASSIRAGGRQTQTRRRGGKSSSNSSVLAIVIVVVAIAAVAAILVMILKRPTPGVVKPDDSITASKGPQSDPEESNVRRRFEEWQQAFNGGSIKAIGSFYGADEAAHKSARDYFDPIFFKTGLSYSNFRDVAVSVGKTTASVTFVCDRKTDRAEADVKMTLNWAKSGDGWHIIDQPSK